MSSPETGTSEVKPETNVKIQIQDLEGKLASNLPASVLNEFKERFKDDEAVTIRDRLDGAYLQIVLKRFGFNPHGIDGLVGNKTKAALKEFKTDYNSKGLVPPINVNDSFDKNTLEALEHYCSELPVKDKEKWTHYEVENPKSGSYIRFILDEKDEEPEKTKKIVAKHIIQQADKGMIKLEEHEAEDELEKPVLSDRERSRREIAEAKKLQQKLAKGYSVTISGKPTEELDDEEVSDEMRSRQEIAAAKKRQEELRSGQSVIIDADPIEDTAEEAA